MKLTEETKSDIRSAFANMTGSGVPEWALARMLADHAIGLLENQRSEWFQPSAPEPLEVGLRDLADAIWPQKSELGA